MVNIRLSDAYCASKPFIADNPNAFIFSIGCDKYNVPSQSRSSSNYTSLLRNGSPLQINLIPGGDFGVENENFQSLVNSAQGGGSTELLNRILFYVGIGTLEVRQDNGPLLTAKQILNYVAP
jgi:hypothetical protein